MDYSVLHSDLEEKVISEIPLMLKADDCISQSVLRKVRFGNFKTDTRWNSMGSYFLCSGKPAAFEVRWRPQKGSSTFVDKGLSNGTSQT